MKKGLLTFIVIPLTLMSLSFLSFNVNKTVHIDYDALSVDGLALNYTVTPELATDNFNFVNRMSNDCFASPSLGKSFVGFKEALAFKESRGNYFSVNTFGYMGKYQFGKGTLALIGVYNTSNFLNNPKLQEKAFLANAMRNKWILRREILAFVGTHINGVLITESGILAAAHLAGPGSVKKYLRSYGAVGFTDAYGTTIKKYMKRFSGYDTSFIKSDRKAKVSRI